MDNKLRIQRVKEGIKLLEEGIDPYFNTPECITLLTDKIQ